MVIIMFFPYSFKFFTLYIYEIYIQNSTTHTHLNERLLVSNDREKFSLFLPSPDIHLQPVTLHS